MDSQAEYLESSGGADLFRNVATGEKTLFINYQVHIDRRGRYWMDDKTMVTVRDEHGREEKWWIQYIPITYPGLAYSTRIWPEPDAASKERWLSGLAALLGAIVIMLLQAGILWLWLK